MTMDSGYYEASRRGIEDDYAAKMAANTYGRSLAQTRGSRDLAAMRQGFGRAVPRFSAGFAQRGFGPGTKSGAMQQSMRNFVGDYNTDYTNASNDLVEQLRQFDLNAAQYGQQRTNAFADIELQKAREIQFAAQNIEALRQILGGL